MNKVLPLLIVPPLFLIFFLNVENLTVKLDNKLKNYPVLESNENTMFQNKKDKEITISNENLNKNRQIPATIINIAAFQGVTNER